MTSMILVPGAIALGGLWLLWCLFRAYLVRSPLDNIPGPPSSSFLKGDLLHAMTQNGGWAFHKELGEKYGPIVRFTEMFGKRALFVFDPKALYSIVVKDQHIYERTPFQIHGNNLIVGPGILSAIGENHRRQRKILTPVFSIAHMRYMTPIFYETMHRLRKAIMAEIKGSSGEVDVLNWMGRAALELIGRGGLGHSFDPLVADMKDTYGHALKTLQPAMSKCRLWLILSPYHHLFGPAWLRRFLINCVPDPNLQRLKCLIDIMHSNSQEIYYKKKNALLWGDEDVKMQISQGKDIMSVLLKANLEAPEEERLSEDEVVGQMSTLVFAATDTTSSILSRTLDLLAQHPDIQEKLRTELVKTRDGQDVSYDTLVNLPYLDAICRETLRLYPPTPFANRYTYEDTVLPLSKPICGLDGSMMNKIFVPRGTLVMIGSWMSNVNKEIWGEDADEWKPERWLSPLPEALKSARIPGIYSNLMTFLGGSRACIGFKFSQLEMKVVLSILLEAFKFSPSDKPAYWNFSGIIYPTVEKNSSNPSLRLKVQALAAEPRTTHV